MELIRGLSSLKPRHRGCVATIGNFDGVHCGHQAVIKQVIDMANRLRLPSQVVIFEPLPREFFAGSKAPGRLTRIREKLEAFQKFSIDRLLCLRFNQTLADMAPQSFITRILVDGLGVRHLVVGDDFQFGKNRAGNFTMLQEAGRRFGFEVASMPSFIIARKRVSSTLIRHALQRGDMQTAQQYLGRPYRISGRIVQGEKLGRKLGFPTANLRLGRQVSPVHGVFAAKVYGLRNPPLNAVVNIGSRPTVSGKDDRLEVHLLNFADDIYGHHLHVDLLFKLREEKRFESLDALKHQIHRDIAMARDFL